MLASIELKFALLGERVYVETLVWEEAMTQACMLSLSFLPLLMLMACFFFSRSSRNAIPTTRNDKAINGWNSHQGSIHMKLPTLQSVARQMKTVSGVGVVFQGKYGASQTIASWLNATKTT